MRFISRVIKQSRATGSNMPQLFQGNRFCFSVLLHCRFGAEHHALPTVNYQIPRNVPKAPVGHRQPTPTRHFGS
jgi:hypothetical protein